MATSPLHPASLAGLLLLLVVPAPALAWQGTFPRVDLSCPAPEEKSDLIVGGTVLDPLPPGTQSIDVDGFPCAKVAFPPDVARTPFPLLGGAIQLNFTAPDPSQKVNGTTQWIVNFYIGQLAGNTVVALNTSANVDTYAWNSSDFALGTWTSQGAEWPTLNVTEKLVENGIPYPLPLDGLEATIGVSIERFGGLNGDISEDMQAQCAYVRFTSDAFSTPYCGGATLNPPNEGGSGSSVVSGAPAAATSSSATPPAVGGPTSVSPSSSTGTRSSLFPPSSPSPSSPSPSATHALSIGVGVGVTCSAAVLFLAAAFLFLRRRRRQQRRASMNTEIVSMPPDEKDAMFKNKPPSKHAVADAKAAKVKGDEEEDEDGKLGVKGLGEKDVEGSSIASGTEAVSIRSEQLPSYSQAVTEQGGK